MKYKVEIIEKLNVKCESNKTAHHDRAMGVNPPVEWLLGWMAAARTALLAAMKQGNRQPHRLERKSISTENSRPQPGFDHCLVVIV